MSDVYATIEMAKLIKQKQPKLFDYLFSLRNKKQVAQQIDCYQRIPLVSHFIQVTGNQWLLHLDSTHLLPSYKQKCRDSAEPGQLDPSPLFELEPEQLREKLYQPSSMLEPGEQRLPVKLLHINKWPGSGTSKNLNGRKCPAPGYRSPAMSEKPGKNKELSGSGAQNSPACLNWTSTRISSMIQITLCTAGAFLATVIEIKWNKFYIYLLNN